MHLAFLTRGHINYVEDFIKELRAQYLPLDRYNPKTKKLEKKFTNVRLCPIQLWDIAFPKEFFDPVAMTIMRGNETPHKGQQKFLWGLRKAMGFSKIPKYKTDQALIMRPHENINAIGIGVKEDKWITEKGEYVDEKDKTDLSWEGL